MMNCLTCEQSQQLAEEIHLYFYKEGYDVKVLSTTHTIRSESIPGNPIKYGWCRYEKFFNAKGH